MQKLNQVIGIGGVSTVGKDSFFNLLKQKLPQCQRFSLADLLKQELDPFFIQEYGISIFSCTPEEKELLRPFLISHGMMRRLQSQGRYWINNLEPQIRDFHKNDPQGIAVITDIRFDNFEKDEVNWLKNELGGLLVHIKRYKDYTLKAPDFIESWSTMSGRSWIGPASKDEEENDPKLQLKADYKVIWPTALNIENKTDLSSLEIYAEEFLKYLNR